jgi:AcrR family transcriptional regulator
VKNAPRGPSDLRAERSRRSLVDAGAKLFASYGFRHTSMEAIAAEAGVAKTTAYAHFANKEELFDAVVAHVSADMLARAEAAADAAGKSPEAAVLASLLTKEQLLFALVHTSRHAQELLDASTSVGGIATARAHDAYTAALARRLARCKGVGKKLAPSVADLLDRAAYGLAARASTAAELSRGIELLVRRVVG